MSTVADFIRIMDNAMNRKRKEQAVERVYYHLERAERIMREELHGVGVTGLDDARHDLIEEVFGDEQ